MKQSVNTTGLVSSLILAVVERAPDKILTRESEWILI